ncbi:MAG: hypothetical protein MZV63_17435 [Marinilabiliales bacterium]|nr:hypothetical protein [Marinilabiliales bacterium]
MAMKRCVSCRSGDLRESREAVEVRVPSAPKALVVRVTGVLAEVWWLRRVRPQRPGPRSGRAPRRR